MQLDVPEGVKPVTHVGVQVAPLAREAVQSPTPPSVGAVLASHGSGGQRADLLPAEYAEAEYNYDIVCTGHSWS